MKYIEAIYWLYEIKHQVVQSEDEDWLLKVDTLDIAINTIKEKIKEYEPKMTYIEALYTKKEIESRYKDVADFENDDFYIECCEIIEEHEKGEIK